MEIPNASRTRGLLAKMRIKSAMEAIFFGSFFSFAGVMGWGCAAGEGAATTVSAVHHRHHGRAPQRCAHDRLRASGLGNPDDFMARGSLRYDGHPMEAWQRRQPPPRGLVNGSFTMHAGTRRQVLSRCWRVLLCQLCTADWTTG